MLFNNEYVQLNKRKPELISSEYLFNKIIELETLEACAKFFSLERRTFRLRLKEYLPCYPELNCRGNRTLRIALLEKLNKAYCCKCNKVLPMEEFHKTNINTAGIRYTCKTCCSQYRNTEYHRKYNKIHYSNNKAYYWNKKQHRRARQVMATTKFGQEGIEEFYLNKPEGMHIDHIIPLKHPLVSGLHNIYNLQYLSAEDNLRKSNKFSTE